MVSSGINHTGSLAAWQVCRQKERFFIRMNCGLVDVHWFWTTMKISGRKWKRKLTVDDAARAIVIDFRFRSG
jgi:hypothetical protein